VRSLRLLLVLALGVSLLATAPADAEPAVALTGGNQLLLFDTATPSVATGRPVTGLGVGETLRGIDQRPASLALYGAAVTSGAPNNSVVRTYLIDPATGAATLIGTTGALAGAGDVATGWDFNPRVDRARYTSANDENARITPSNGSLASDDTDLNPGSTDVIAEAYDRSVKDAEATTLFAIDRSNSTLARQGGVDGSPSADDGAVTTIGGLGFLLHPAEDGGFDISATGGAYAALSANSDGLTRLYTVNLATGLASVVGFIGNGQLEVYSLAILNPRPLAAPLPPLPAARATADNTRPQGLLSFPRQIRTSAFLRAGLRGRFGATEACTATARLILGKLTLGRGTRRLSDAGVGRLRIRATAAGRKKLRHRSRVRTKLRVQLVDRAGNRKTIYRKVALR
jgi:hypothetical protein